MHCSVCNVRSTQISLQCSLRCALYTGECAILKFIFAKYIILYQFAFVFFKHQLTDVVMHPNAKNCETKNKNIWSILVPFNCKLNFFKFVKKYYQNYIHHCQKVSDQIYLNSSSARNRKVHVFHTKLCRKVKGLQCALYSLIIHLNHQYLVSYCQQKPLPVGEELEEAFWKRIFNHQGLFTLPIKPPKKLVHDVHPNFRHLV